MSKESPRYTEEFRKGVVSLYHNRKTQIDWRNKQSRSSQEMGNPKSRPAIKGKKEHISDYDVIFIDYPI